MAMTVEVLPPLADLRKSPRKMTDERTMSFPPKTIFPEPQMVAFREIREPESVSMYSERK